MPLRDYALLPRGAKYYDQDALVDELSLHFLFFLVKKSIVKYGRKTSIHYQKVWYSDNICNRKSYCQKIKNVVKKVSINILRYIYI